MDLFFFSRKVNECGTVYLCALVVVFDKKNQKQRSLGAVTTSDSVQDCTVRRGTFDD